MTGAPVDCNEVAIMQFRVVIGEQVCAIELRHA
jgi:hypothetical protein